jgi:hypothetical protein
MKDFIFVGLRRLLFVAGVFVMSGCMTGWNEERFTSVHFHEQALVRTVREVYLLKDGSTYCLAEEGYYRYGQTPSFDEFRNGTFTPMPDVKVATVVKILPVGTQFQYSKHKESSTSKGQYRSIVYGRFAGPEEQSTKWILLWETKNRERAMQLPVFFLSADRSS